MQIKRITVKPEKDGTVQIRIEGLDDAGHYLTHSVVSPTVSAYTQVMQTALKDLSAFASSSSEEEGYEAKLKRKATTG